MKEYVEIASAKEEDIFDPKAYSSLSDSELKNKQDRYREFNADQEINKITQRVFGTDPTHFAVAGNTANAFDHVVFEVRVTVDGQERSLVYRIAASTDPALDLELEKMLHALWGENGIPSPRIYAAEPRGEDFPYGFMVMDKVGTGSLEARLAEQPSEGNHYAREAGKFLSTLHKIKLPRFGSLSLRQAQNGTLTGVAHSWGEALRVRLDETTEYLVTHGIIDNETVVAVYDAFDRGEHLLDLAQGMLLHGDYHDANILIDEETRSIAGAIDLSQPKIGDPLFDVAFYATYYPQEKVNHFLEGYFLDTARPDDMARKISLYQLRIYMSKAKLRKRFGYEDRIPAAVVGIQRSLKFLTTI